MFLVSPFLPRVEAQHFLQGSHRSQVIPSSNFLTQDNHVSPGRYHYHPGVQSMVHLSKNIPTNAWKKHNDPEKCIKIGDATVNEDAPPSCLKVASNQVQHVFHHPMGTWERKPSIHLFLLRIPVGSRRIVGTFKNVENRWCLRNNHIYIWISHKFHVYAVKVY